MTLTNGAEAYANKHGKDARDKERLKEAYRAGYLQCVDNWCNKSRT